MKYHINSIVPSEPTAPLGELLLSITSPENGKEVVNILQLPELLMKGHVFRYNVLDEFLIIELKRNLQQFHVSKRSKLDTTHLNIYHCKGYPENGKLLYQMQLLEKVAAHTVEKVIHYTNI